MAGVMVLSGAQEREALGFGQSAGSAATGPASWPPPQPPALAKHARPGQPGPCPRWSSLQSLLPSLQGLLLQETPLFPGPGPCLLVVVGVPSHFCPGLRPTVVCPPHRWAMFTHVIPWPRSNLGAR